MINERSVVIDAAYEWYVIDHGDRRTILTFDDCMWRIADYGIELAGRGRLPASFIDTPVQVPRGTLAAYDTMCILADELVAAAQADGDQPQVGYCEQLVDLEGHAVEVLTNTGETRRFIVGVADEAIPHHLEIAGSRVRDAERTYQWVRDFGNLG